MFITTANALERIPRPLQDRMEIIRIAGYTELEKLNIAKRYLVQKQREANGLSEDNIEFIDSALLSIIRHYTKEAGVRNLEREIASVCRKVGGRGRQEGSQRQGQGNAEEPRKAASDRPATATERRTTSRRSAWRPGWRGPISAASCSATEVTVMPGKGKLIITGKLGDVMQESAQAAMSYVRSRAEALGLERDFYQKVDIHIHVPEGAIPKDGPSAGITMATALVSALTRTPVRHDIAMTGEITLRGSRAADRRPQGEGACGPSRGDQASPPSHGERAGHQGHPLDDPQVDPFELVDHMDHVLRKALVLTDPESFLRQQLPPESAPRPFPQGAEATPEIITH